ncbi:MAG TPA: redoxin domain-containing protein, partial [Opitutus sp.]|nr:redoxin domain-containing protein [Opitutus sp.]
MNTTKKILLFAAAIAAAFVTAVQADVKVGAPAPDFSVTDIQGKAHRLSDYKGKTVVLEWVNPECPIVMKHYGSGNMP